MGNDELEDAKGEPDANQPPEPESAPSSEEDEKSSRVDAAKAFFRAMYAGEEPPASFGQQAQGAASDASTATACRNCEALEFSVKEAEQKAAESDTLYKRMAADFENYRRRMDREREESVSLGVKKAAESLMPALDDLGRALQFLGPDTPSDKVIESFKLVANRITQCMEQVGLKKIVAVGQPFDPKYHEPVQQIETTEYPDGTVIQELRAGYILNDKVVRPSLVNVSSNPTGVVTGPAEKTDSGAESQGETGQQQAAAVDPSDLEHTVITSTTEAPAAPAADDQANTVYDLEDTPDS